MGDMTAGFGLYAARSLYSASAGHSAPIATSAATMATPERDASALRASPGTTGAGIKAASWSSRQKPPIQNIKNITSPKNSQP